jgi:hypothetical protein
MFVSGMALPTVENDDGASAVKATWRELSGGGVVVVLGVGVVVRVVVGVVVEVGVVVVGVVVEDDVVAGPAVVPVKRVSAAGLLPSPDRVAEEPPQLHNPLFPLTG